MLQLEIDIEIVTEASSGLECLQLIERFCPDVILMDVRMPGISGIETTRLICHKYPSAKVIMLTIYEEEQLIKEAIQAGARGYVLKKVNRDDLIKIIRHVFADQAFLDPTVTAAVFDHVRKGSEEFGEIEKPRLTQRELEILKDLVAGKTDRSIGESLYISKHTVRSHVKNIYKKLGVSSKSQAVAKALKKKLIN